MTLIAPSTPSFVDATSPCRRPGALRLVAITDLHVGGIGSAVWHNELRFEGVLEDLSSTVDQAQRLEADALVILGDLTDRGDADSFAAVRRVCDEFQGPVRTVAGNHDRALDNHTFEETFAADHEDEIRLAGPERIDRFGPVALTGVRVTSQDAGATSAGAPLDLESWPASLTVLLSHYPVLSVGGELKSRGLRDSGDLANAEACFAALAHRVEPTLVLNGHLHARHQQVSGAVLQLSCAAFVESPHEVTLIDIEVEPVVRVIVHRYSARATRPDRSLAPILCPSNSRWSWDGSSWRLSTGAVGRDTP